MQIKCNSFTGFKFYVVIVCNSSDFIRRRWNATFSPRSFSRFHFMPKCKNRKCIGIISKIESLFVLLLKDLYKERQCTVDQGQFEFEPNRPLCRPLKCAASTGPTLFYAGSVSTLMARPNLLQYPAYQPIIGLFYLPHQLSSV